MEGRGFWEERKEVFCGDGTGLDFFNAESQRSRSEHRGRTGGDFEFFEEEVKRGGDRVERDGVWSFFWSRWLVMDGVGFF